MMPKEFTLTRELSQTSNRTNKLEKINDFTTEKISILRKQNDFLSCKLLNDDLACTVIYKFY